MGALRQLLDTAAGSIIAWGTAAGIVLALLRWAWRGSRRMHQVADVILGRPHPDPAKHRPGLPEWVEGIDKELRPNGGASLRDAVDGTRSALAALRNDVAEVRRELAEHKAEHARGPVTVNVGPHPPAG